MRRSAMRSPQAKGGSDLALSVIIPAYNEESYLPATLEHLTVAGTYLKERGGVLVETIVVDNASTDLTAAVAETRGAIVLSENVRNVARARNVGARAARGNILVFVDADTLIPQGFLSRISDLMSENPNCVGGAVDTEYLPARRIVWAYLWAWRICGRLCGLAQGAAQFCRREAFETLGGYDQSLYMGEDVDFYLRLRRLARSRGEHVSFIEKLRVRPSCRRFDQWPLWRILLWTNPAIVFLLRRRHGVWSGWYNAAPR